MSEPPKSLRDRAMDFLFLQPPTTVLLAAILTAFLAAAYYGVQDIKAMVPVVVRQIQDGYDRTEDKQTEQIKAITADRAEERTFMRELIERRDSKAIGANP